MEPVIIGIKQLHQELSAVAQATARGKSFVVVKHAKPIFRIEPIGIEKHKTHTLESLAQLRFSSKKKTLSASIDKLIYGT